MRAFASLVPFVFAAVSCGGGNDSPRLDSGGIIDGSLIDGAHGDGALGDGGSAYRHTIVIDGSNDFTAEETLSTTASPTFSAYVTWDDANIYIGYAGPDLSTTATDASTKWLFAYVDIDPGASTGAATSEQYNTQKATFPSGYGAEYYLRFKSDGTFKSLRKYNGTSWDEQAAAPDSANAGTYTEAAFPRSLLTGETAGLVTYMIDEKDEGEATFAGLYAGNFTDGYGSDDVLAYYMKVDFASTKPPSDPSYRAPTQDGD